MSSHSTLGVAALVLLVAGMADVHAYECTGMGRKYCTDEDPAHQTRTQCPRACQRDQCEGRRSTELERAGAERDSSEGGTPRWEEVAMSGLYDHVFVDDDEICLATCWFEPWNSKCDKWETYLGAKYCKSLNCKHDKGTKFNEGTRYSGCHAGKDSERRKLPWHKPTCKECTRVFPEACFRELRSHYSKTAVKQMEERAQQARQTHELEARQFCYMNYFGPLLDQSAPRRRSRKSGESSSESRKLLSSGENPFSFKLDPKTIQQFNILRNSGFLTCPAPQCLTFHDSLLQSLIAPWYHTSGAEGRCSFDGCKSDKPQGADWCKDSVDNCVKCDGTWCPPKSVPFWRPVNEETYEPLYPFYQETDIYRRFPRGACSYMPLTGISIAEAQGVPWFDPAGDIFGIKPRTMDPRLQGIMQNVRNFNNRDLIKEHEENEARLAEERRIEELLQAQQQQREREIQMQEAERARKAAAAEAARMRMKEIAKLQREQLQAKARQVEFAARKYCYDRYIDEALRYGGIDLGGGLEALDSESDSEGSQKFQLEEMEASGELRCPPAECYFEEIVQEFADDMRTEILEQILPGDLENKPDAAQEARGIDWKTRSLLPWYYQTSDGFCSWSGTKCDASSVAQGYCGQDTRYCTACGATWCPPVSGEGWTPVTKKSYLNLPEALELVGENPLVVVGYGNGAIQGDSVRDDDEPLVLFDYRMCTNASVTTMPLWQGKDLYWPGMIDFTAAIAKQRGVGGTSEDSQLGNTQRVVRGGV